MRDDEAHEWLGLKVGAISLPELAACVNAVAMLTVVSLTFHLVGLGGEVMTLGPPGRVASNAASRCFWRANRARAGSLLFPSSGCGSRVGEEGFGGDLRGALGEKVSCGKCVDCWATHGRVYEAGMILLGLGGRFPFALGFPRKVSRSRRLACPSGVPENDM